MRLDKENLSRVEKDNNTKVYVRIYEWRKPTISLGVSQKIDAFDLEKMKQHDIDWVVRITGGKAVWHEKEITYSVAASIAHPVFGHGLYSSYKAISEILVLFLSKLGLNAQVERHRNTSRVATEKEKSNICYRQSGLYEINVNGKKLIGSSQKRSKKAFLQHGSIPVFASQSRLNAYLRQPEREYQETKCLSDWLDKANMHEFKKVLGEMFAKELTKRSLTSSESITLI